MAVIKPNSPSKVAKKAKTPPWRVAKSLETLRNQVNTAYPNRKKGSDGTIGNAEHASRSSDHNPYVKDAKGAGVVTAMDITDDPGVIDSNDLMLALLASKDPRIKYLISDGKIYAGSGQKQKAWVARPYTGANGHFHHLHISVKGSADLYDSTAPWDLSALVKIVSKKPSIDAPITPPKESVIRDKATVAAVQSDLWNLGFTEVGSRLSDGTFDGKPGNMTEAAVLAFRNERGLGTDPDINKSLLNQIQRAKADGYKRPIAKARADASSTVVAEKVPEAAESKSASTFAKGLTIASVGGAVVDAAGNVDDAKGFVGKFTEYFPTIPAWGWFVVICLICGYLWYRSHRAVEASKEAFQSGARR